MKEQNNRSRNLIQKKILKTNQNLDFKNFLSKVNKNPVYNAFERKTLGSIPSKIDNYIFNLNNDSDIHNRLLKFRKKFKSENSMFINDIFHKDHRTWKYYGSGNDIELKGNTLKFSVNNSLRNLGKKSEFDKKYLDSFKPFFSYSINSNKSTNLSNNISNINNKSHRKSINLKKKILKNKSLPKMKFPKEDRYNNIYYKKEILEKYTPGPGEYDLRKDIENKNNFRYCSLFKERTSFPIYDIKTPTADIGPGSYDLYRDLNPPGGNFSKLKKYDNFNNPFNISDKEINTSPGENNLPGSITIKNSGKKNYFFMDDSPKKEKLEKKYGIDKNDEKNKKNEYKKDIKYKNWEKGASINTDWIFSKLEKKIKEKIKKGGFFFENMKETAENELKKTKNKYINDINENNIEKNKGKVFSFSKIPRFYNTSNKHVPGPSYYDPEKILYGLKLKKSFNAKENVWI